MGHNNFKICHTGGKFSHLENTQENHQNWLNYLMKIYGDKPLENFQIPYNFLRSVNTKETLIFMAG